MTVYYNETGKVQIVAAADDYNIKALKNGNIIYDTTRGTTYVIINTKCDTTNNRITINGYTTDWLLNKRIISQKNYVTTIETGVYSIINANLRSLPRISTAAVKGLTEKYTPLEDDSSSEDDDGAIYGGQLLEEITPLLEQGELGYRMVWDAANLAWKFEIYKGNDLTAGIHAVAFVEDQGTCTDLVINEDASTFKNVGYVKYKLSDDTEPIAVVGTAEGANRFEKWFDTSVQQEDGETAADCRKRAVSYATLELGKYINRQSFNVTIDASELGTLSTYDL